LQGKRKAEFTHSWEYTGDSNHNHLYRNPDNQQIGRVAKNPHHPVYCHPERLARVYSEINGKDTAHVEETPYGTMWVSPFVQGHPLSTQEKLAYILDIYKKLKRLIINAYIHGTLVAVTDSTQHRSIICRKPGLSVRRDSIGSEQTWYSDSCPYAKQQRKSYKTHMVQCISEYQKHETYELAKPILLIMGLDYIDRKMPDKQVADIPLHNILSIGILLYFYYSSQIHPQRQQMTLDFGIIDAVLKAKRGLHTDINGCFESDNQIDIAKFCAKPPGEQTVFFNRSLLDSQSSSDSEHSAKLVIDLGAQA
jgi:hypothetical protein